jgi:anti-anti-sigma factor
MTDELLSVRLLQLPVPLHTRASSHLSGLQREFELIRLNDENASSVPNRLRSLIDELDRDLGRVGEQPTAELDAAAERGDETIDLVYRLPATAADASQRLGDLLDEVDDYCRARGHLLTLVSPDDAVAYRRWFLGEFIRQIGGEDPVPWPQHREETRRPSDEVASPTGDPTAIPSPDWTLAWKGRDAVVAVTGSLDLASASALRKLLVELTATAMSVTVDLSRCQFIDSVGVSVLIATLLRAQETGIPLRFRLGEVAARVLQISGVLDHLDIEES